MRVGGEVEHDRAQVGLGDADRQPQRRSTRPGPGRRTAATAAAAAPAAPAGPVQPVATSLDQRRPCLRQAGQLRAATVRKCRLSRGRCPGRAALSGTLAAARRLIIESLGSPSRSSSRVPNRSRTAGRKSIQRGAAATTWTPYDRPRVAMSVMTGSRSSNSLAQRRPAVDHQEHVAERVVGAPPAGGRAAPPVGRHRVDAVLGEPPLPVGEQGRRPRRRCGGRRPGRAGRPRRRRAAGRAARPARRRRSRGSRTAPRPGCGSAPGR